LQKIAAAGGGAYTRATNADLGLDRVIDDIREMEKQEMSSVVFSDFNEQYMYFFGIAFFFFLLEILILERKNRWLKSFDIFR
jgi:Ca-activated chloride channel family protein